MQEVKRAILKNGLVLCHKCKNKLGKVVGKKPPTGLEIECSCCKELNLLSYLREKKETITQYKQPHCKHCVWYKEFTGTCTKALMSWGLKFRAKARGSRNCSAFEPKEEFRNRYKGVENG